MAGGTLASLLIKLGLDATGVKTGADQTTATVTGMSTKLKAGVVAIGAAAGAGLAYAAQAAAKMGGEMAQYQAATGASAAETKAWGQQVNAMAGASIHSLSDIADASTKVRQDFQLTGQAQADLTEQMLKYATATGGDAAQATDDFFAATKAWHQDTEAIPGLMDQLVASEQRYGGSLSDRLAALVKLGPAMQAMNVSQDQTIGLMNLWTRAGLDVQSMQKGLNAAITKLPKGESLVEFLAHLQSISDPTQRATEAIKVFGSRAGPGLANALGDGSKSLDSFIITTQDATGTVDRADAALENTWGAKFTKLLHSAEAGLRGFGMLFGPSLTGISSAVTAFGPVLSRSFGGLWKTVGGDKAVKEAVKLAGEAAGALYAGAVAVADAIVGAISGVWVAVKESPVVQGAAKAAGAVAGGLYAAAAGIAGAVGGAVAGIGEAVGGAAIAGLGTTLGGIAAGVATIGSVALIAGIDVLALKAILDPNTWTTPGPQVVDDLTRTKMAAVEATQNLQAAAMSATGAGLATVHAAQEAQGSIAAMAAAAHGASKQQVSDAYVMGTAWGAMADSMVAQGLTAENAADDLRGAFQWSPAEMTNLVDNANRAGATQVKAYTDSAYQALIKSPWMQVKLQPPVPETALPSGPGGSIDPIRQLIEGATGKSLKLQWAEWWKGLLDDPTAAADEMAAIGARVPGEFAAGMKSQMNTLDGELKTLQADIKAKLTMKTTVAEALGKGLLAAVQKGIKSGDPMLVDEARGVATDALVAIEMSGRKGPHAAQRAGQLISQLLKSGLSMSDVELALAGKGLSQKAIAAFEDLAGIHGPAWQAGQTIADATRTGLQSVNFSAVGDTAGGMFVSGFRGATTGGVTIDIHTKLAPGQHGYLAAGGWPSPGIPQLIGEQGAEFWNPGTPGEVLSHAQIASLLAPQRGESSVVRHEGSVEVHLDAESIAAARKLGASWEDIGRLVATATANANIVSTAPRRF